LEREDRETALVLATDRMCRVAQNPLTRANANELRRLAAKVTELAELSV
jgi:hypothetical protein